MQRRVISITQNASSHWNRGLSKMDPFQIVAIAVISSLLTAIGVRTVLLRRLRGAAPSPDERYENLRLKEQVQQLQDRIKVLERITVDRENSLSREFEELR